MWGWIVQGCWTAADRARRAVAGRAGRLAALLALAAIALAPPAASAAPITFTVPGGKVRILDMPRREQQVRDAVVLTVSEELANQKAQPLGNIDPARCPTGEILITVEKQITLQRKWAEASPDSTEQRQLGALLVRGTPCRMWLNARALHKLDQARICNIVRHELGHARGLDHSTSGLMAPVTPVLPMPGCEWAQSTWLTDAT